MESKNDELSKGEHVDQEITCVDCDDTFLFSAAEAAFFAERELAVPRRCRPCRAVRKRRQAGRMPVGGARERGPRRVSGEGNSRDGRAGERGTSQPAAPEHTGDVNEYRSPMPDPAFPRYQAASNNDGRPRRRARARTFAITCQACGADAEVPFRPREGREVFCSTCYRARKQAANDA